MEKQKTIIGLFALIILATTLTSAITETIFLDDYQIKYTYSGAEEDDTFTLTVDINNTGSQKTDVFFKFDDKDPFNVDSDPDWDIGTLQESEQVSRSFRIEVDDGTDEGKYDLEFLLEDSKEDYEDEMEISVNSNQADLIIGDIKSSPSQITADQRDIKLEVTIENIGGGDANFVRAQINLPEGFEKSDSYSDFVNLGTINSGESKTATFFVNTLKNVKEDNTAEIKLDYKTDSNKETDRLSINLPIKGKPIFEILSSQISPSTIFASDTGTLKISILNKGEEIGEETSIRIFENTDIPLEFSEKTKFIGNLDSGESGSAIFPFDVKSTALPNSYLVKIQVRTINSDSVLTEEFNVPVTVSKKESNPVKIILISAGILLILLIIILVYLLRRQ